MKYKNRQLNLKARQAAFDRMFAKKQRANTKPRSEKK